MSRKPTTPLQLAKLLGCETDDVLIMLWDAGILYPKTPLSPIRPQDVAKAQRACAVTSPKSRTQVQYWLSRTGLTRPQFSNALSLLGVALASGARTLPKGALSKVEKRFATEPALANAAPKKKPTPASAQAQPEPFRWRSIGHQRDSIQLLDRDHVEAIHFAIAEDFRGGIDPISPAGVRDEHLLESATTRPRTSLGDQRKYPTVELAAAALMHSLVHNHAFYNGNKRTALVSVLSFLDRNGYVIICNQDELFRWTVRVAQHGLSSNSGGDKSDMEVAEMAQWIVNNARPIGHGERVVTWKLLRRRLQVMGCDLQLSGNRGGRMVVTRTVSVTTRGMFGSRVTQVERKFTLPYSGDGRQVSRQRLKEMRKELQLSEEYGIDSENFYGEEPAPVDEFIATYRKTLARLAKI